MTPALLVDGARVLVQGREMCLIESRSNPGQYHVVQKDGEGRLYCSCIGWTTRRKCWHVTRIEDWLAGKAKARVEAGEVSLDR